MKSVLITSLGFVALTGCLPEDAGDIEAHLTVYVSSGTEIDAVQIFGGTTPIAVGGELPTAPITPAMLAASQPVPSSAQIFGLGGAYLHREGLPAPATQFTYTAINYDAGDQPSYMLVVGFRGGQPVGAAELSPAPSTITDDAASVALETSVAPEVWSGNCVRLPTFDGGAHYVVRLGDYDCDGEYSPNDCKPSTFCDPHATSGPAAAACTCT